MDEFRPYLDAVTKSGDRTRTFIYILVIINFCILAAVLNGIAPDWNDVRLERLNKALDCLMTASQDTTCKPALEYANIRGFQYLTDTSNKPLTTEALRQLKKRIDHYQDKSVDENAFQIPLFNVLLDVNDLWVLSGLLNCYLMFFVVGCLEREYEDLVLAVKYAPDNKAKEILLTTQMLAKPVGNLGRLPIDKLFKVSIMITPLLLHAKVVYEFILAKTVLKERLMHEDPVALHAVASVGQLC